ncbi:acyl-CoA N-acyltransferase [Basidiobolus meristosporus CBS 931.73]|uniref:Acyl-CoA N-acyltransferase n=1 Tax=Basidiobolus meristosporus CBS 931.73 TaxID=1314790 RepID=A0A1Y1YXL9_9FUNG|nr:acyl-CoA N-acyltransferase [Basidiobolus meristosporus CBS 931.73]|eukprot:ORY02634.1 acyl-CoA N-acyltransferase [Basidiobolus meristosporus CBS 931.73]
MLGTGQESSNTQSRPKIEATSKFTLHSVNEQNLAKLRRLNSVLFPIKYSERFYQVVQEAGEMAKLAYFKDTCVGTVCCRREHVSDSPEQTELYLMTLGVLSPYRRCGLGAMLLQHIFTECAKEKNIVKVYLHTQSGNQEALKFYEKFGFIKSHEIEHYYRHIQDSNAYVLYKDLVPK